MAFGQFAGNQVMPRLNLSISESFTPSAKTMPGSHGRRVRCLPGVEVAGAASQGQGPASIFVKVAVAAGLVAAFASAPAIWRLLRFP
jgi:hypothetical protein